MGMKLNVILIVLLILETIMFITYIENHHIEITINHKIDLGQNITDIDIDLSDLKVVEDKINEVMEWARK